MVNAQLMMSQDILSALPWVDTHVHADAPEFDADRSAVREAARACGVRHIVIPAVARAHWPQAVRVAEDGGDSYALGIHPLFTPQAKDEDIAALRQEVQQRWHDRRFVAVGEVGLDFFVTHLDEARQRWFWHEQACIAHDFGLPMILHVRKSADALLATLRQLRQRAALRNLGPKRGFSCSGSGGELGQKAPQSTGIVGGIAHAFNGSEQQAAAFIDLGFKLGFGGALTFERAHKLRRLVQDLPLSAIVLETDAPDIAPQWLYVNAQQRAAGQPQARNTSAELPRIAQCIAELRGISVQELAHACAANARAALRGLPAWNGTNL